MPCIAVPRFPLRLLIAAACCAFSPLSGLVAQQPREVPGVAGAIPIRFTMPEDGTATVALYNKEGRLIRPLGQVLPLTQGDHVIRWDGMDLFGNPLPAGAELEARVFTGPTLRAKWEFGIASPNPVPWPTKAFGEGDAMRAGGWLGDHGVSASAVAVGDRIFIGSGMAEHGHTVIFCNLDGDKMWGRGGLDGWVGPMLLASDGSAVFGVVKDSQIHRLELDGSSSNRIATTGEDKIAAIAAREGKIHVALKNHIATASVVDPRLGGRDFGFGDCIPVPEGSRAYNRNLTGQEQFATTFFDGGHPQSAIAPKAAGAAAGIVARFKNPVPIGTLLVERMEIPVKAEFYILKPGTKYSPGGMAPVAGEAPGPDWQLLGQSDLARRINAITAPAAGLATEALYIRLTATSVQPPAKWPRFTMCRILPQRLDRVDTGAKITLPPEITVEPLPTGAVASDTAWAFHSKDPITKSGPKAVMLDYGKPVTFDGLALQNCVNHSYLIDRWTDPQSAPDPKADAKWVVIKEQTAGTGKIEGSIASSTHSNDTRISLDETVITRAIRIRFVDGKRGGRWSIPMNDSDPSMGQAADVALLRLVDGRPKSGRMILRRIDGRTGATEFESNHPSVDMTEMAFAPDGTLWTVSGNRLNKTKLPTQPGGAVEHQVVNADTLKGAVSLAVSPDGSRIAVGDDATDAVFVFDPAGKLLTKIGGTGPRREGPWDGMTVDRPGGITIDKHGKIWVCEHTYTPKRVTRYSADGQFEKELLGPPHYGGGGAISTDLKSFWYELCEYSVDFGKGTTHLKALNDVQSDPHTPSTELGSYGYTRIGRPIDLNGRRYLVGDVGGQFSPSFVVTLHDPATGTARPAAILGSAQGNPFLTREDKPWSPHWLGKELKDHSFIWCDLNGDGIGQVEEVDLFKNSEVMTSDVKGTPFGGAYWGSFCGPDLTFWSGVRVSPSRFTDKGVPVYERTRLRPFNHAALAPIYMGNLRYNSSASTGYGGVSMVTHDGSLIHMGQPYVVGPDLTIKGGPVTEKPSDLIPSIAGTIIDNPLSFVGSALTKGAVPEVAMINGNNGRWFLWAVREGVVLGEIFTGKAGGFGGITHPVRGMDLTDYKNDWETFFGYFTKADNGNYYVISGRGHFGLSKVEGIDEIRVAKQMIRVPAESMAANTGLRGRLAGAKNVKREKRELTVPVIAKRLTAFKADGDLAEWGDVSKFQKIGTDAVLGFDAAWDPQGLVIAYRGTSGLGNNSEDWKYLFKTGFAFDLMIRPSADSKSDEASKGDVRVVFGRHKGTWTAVLYDYVAPGAPATAGVAYTSPVTSTHVARVVQLPSDAVQIGFREGADLGVAGREWTAEVRVAWKSLGINPAAGTSFWADFGILSPDSGGIQVERRTYWSNLDTGHVADLAVEAQIAPANWGTAILGAP